MSKRKSLGKCVDAVAFDLHDFDSTLARLLPSLLRSRDRESLVRWCQVRSWVDNAQAGDSSPDLMMIAVAVTYLVERAAE